MRCKNCKCKLDKLDNIVIWIFRVCSEKCKKEFIKKSKEEQREKKLIKIEKDKLRKVKKKEKKATSPKKLYKENTDLAKLIAKKRDKYICQWCDKDYSNDKSNIHWSHIINEARDHRLATNELNIKALCYHCHINLWHKDPVLASEWFNNKFPWRYETLQNIHIENGKLWSISREWHIQENIRLKNVLQSL